LCRELAATGRRCWGSASSCILPKCSSQLIKRLGRSWGYRAIGPHAQTCPWRDALCSSRSSLQSRTPVEPHSGCSQLALICKELPCLTYQDDVPTPPHHPFSSFSCKVKEGARGAVILSRAGREQKKNKYTCCRRRQVALHKNGTVVSSWNFFNLLHFCIDLLASRLAQLFLLCLKMPGAQAEVFADMRAAMHCKS